MKLVSPCFVFHADERPKQLLEDTGPLKEGNLYPKRMWLQCESKLDMSGIQTNESWDPGKVIWSSMVGDIPDNTAVLDSMAI